MRDSVQNGCIVFFFLQALKTLAEAFSPCILISVVPSIPSDPWVSLYLCPTLSYMESTPSGLSSYVKMMCMRSHHNTTDSSHVHALSHRSLDLAW